MHWRSFVLAVGLGVATCFLISAIDRLPYSERPDAVRDLLTLPGGLIAGLVYPQGVHTGNGAAYWGLMAALSNLAFYTAFWFLCVQGVRRLWRNKA